MTSSTLETMLPRFDPAERERRTELAAAFRLLAEARLDDTVYTHASARMPTQPGRFYTNRFGTLYDEATASGLIELNEEGCAVEASVGAVNPAAIAMHAAIYAHRPDVVCIIHTRTLAGTTVAAMECGLLPINEISLEFYNRIACHDYEGRATGPEECGRLLADLGERNAMILRNHGLLVMGGSVPEAFYLMYYLEQACRVQVAALSSGQQLRLAYPALADFTARQFESLPDKGQRLWQALVRRLDRADPTYRA